MKSIKSIIWILTLYSIAVLVMIIMFIYQAKETYIVNSAKVIDLIMKTESKSLEQVVDVVIEAIELKKLYSEKYNDENINYIEKNIDKSIGIIEVLNYDGGDDFARLIYDKDSKSNELLSITTEDNDVNLFFKNMLKNIEENGYGLDIYYGEERDNKYPLITYYKEYEDFNWIIVTGIYKSDIITYLENDIKVIDNMLKEKLEWFIIITVAFLGITVIVLNYIYSYLKSKRIYLLKLENRIIEEHHKIIEEKYEKTNSIIHDFKNHTVVMKGFIDMGDIDEFNSYIERIYSLNFNWLQNTIVTKNKALDIILNEKISIMKYKGIEFEPNIRCIDFNNIDNIDLVILIGNLMDNAIESSYKSKEKLIRLSIYEYNKNFMVIKIINTSDYEPKQIGEKRFTNKKNKDYHGYGIKNVKRIISKYNGTIIFKYHDADKAFEVTMMLPKNN